MTKLEQRLITEAALLAVVAAAQDVIEKGAGHMSVEEEALAVALDELGIAVNIDPTEAMQSLLLKKVGVC